MNIIDVQKYHVSPEDFIAEHPPRQVSGGNGLVTFGTQKGTEKKCALKKTQQTLLLPDTKRSFDREVETLIKCKHPTIVPFVGWCIKDNIGYIYLNEMERGSLDHVIRENSKYSILDDTRKYIISFGVAVAMEFLHSMDVIHRDLKPGNVLLDENLHPYVTDFGTAKTIDKSKPINQTLSFTTPIIMAPEFFENPEEFSNTKPIDVYSFGILLYHLWTEMAPFPEYQKNIFQLISFVINGGRPTIPNVLPEHWKNIIEKCWDQNPSNRPTFTELRAKFEEDVFLHGLDQQAIDEYKRFLTTGETEAGIRRGFLCSTLRKFRESPMLTKLRKAADLSLGDKASQYQYAFAQYEGTYGTYNPEEAVKYFLAIANDKDANKSENIHQTATCLYYAGKCYLLLEQYEKAHNAFRRALCAGNMEANFEIAELIFDGKINKDLSSSIQFYKMAADAKILRAINKFALITYEGTITGKPDHRNAIPYFQMGSDLGDPEMIYMWSNRLEFGISTKKDINEAMRLLKLSADLNYFQAQIDYALHLYHGLHVDQDVAQAKLYLEKVAHQDCSPEAQFLYSRLIEDENPQLAQTYLERSYAFRFPEAFAVIGKQQYEAGQVSDAISSLSFAMGYGSINAAITFGHIAEATGQFGEADQYFKHAANHCHALDEQGFYYPDTYKLFHCDDCDIDICEACAIHCHKLKHHAIREIGITHDMKCKCGAEGFEEKCNCETIGEDNALQHLYLCQSCCMSSDKKLVCKNCAEKCHKGHALVDMGVQRNHCSCGLNQLPFHFKCKIVPDLESNHQTVMQCLNTPQKQRWFQCMQCGLYGDDSRGICKSCAKCCHQGHLLIDKGIQEGSCCCPENCELKHD